MGDGELGEVMGGGGKRERSWGSEGKRRLKYAEEKYGKRGKVRVERKNLGRRVRGNKGIGSRESDRKL